VWRFRGHSCCKHSCFLEDEAERRTLEDDSAPVRMLGSMTELDVLVIDLCIVSLDSPVEG
jgi:hypothetical protein